jgi:hypothetical protein
MPHLATYVGLADHSEKTLADALRTSPTDTPGRPTSSNPPHPRSMERRTPVRPAAGRQTLRRAGSRRAKRLHADGLAEVREGEIGLVRDLQDLHVLATLVQTTWTIIAQGAVGLRDHELLKIAQRSNARTARQLTWLNTRMKQAAPQALIVAP